MAIILSYDTEHGPWTFKFTSTKRRLRRGGFFKLLAPAARGGGLWLSDRRWCASLRAALWKAAC